MDFLKNARSMLGGLVGGAALQGVQQLKRMATPQLPPATPPPPIQNPVQSWLQPAQNMLQNAELTRINFQRESQNGEVGKRLLNNPVTNFGANMLIEAGKKVPQDLASMARVTPVGQMIQSVQNYQNKANPLENAKRQGADLYNSLEGLGMISGLVNPTNQIIGGGLGVGMNAVGNLLSGKKPLDNYGKAAAEGVMSAGPINLVSEGVGAIFPKLNPEATVNPVYNGMKTAGDKFKTVLPSLERMILGATREGVEGLIGGGIRPLREGETRKQALTNDTLFGTGLGILGQGAKELKVQIAGRVVEDLMQRRGFTEKEANKAFTDFMLNEGKRILKQKYIADTDEPYYFKDIRKALVLPENGDYIPSPGATVRPLQRTDTGEIMNAALGTRQPLQYKETAGIEQNLRENLSGAKNEVEAAHIINDIVKSYDGADDNTLLALRAALNKQLESVEGPGHASAYKNRLDAAKHDPFLNEIFHTTEAIKNYLESRGVRVKSLSKEEKAQMVKITKIGGEAPKKPTPISMDEALANARTRTGVPSITETNPITTSPIVPETPVIIQPTVQELLQPKKQPSASLTEPVGSPTMPLKTESGQLVPIGNSKELPAYMRNGENINVGEQTPINNGNLELPAYLRKQEPATVNEMLNPNMQSKELPAYSRTITQEPMTVNENNLDVPTFMRNEQTQKPILKTKEGRVIDPFEAEMDAQIGKMPEVTPKAKQEILQMSGSDADKMAERAQIITSEDKSTWKKIFSRFIGERDAAQTRGTVMGSKVKNVPAKFDEVVKAIEDPSRPMTAEVKAYLADFRKLDDEVFKMAKDAGQDVEYRANHLPHIWQQPVQQVQEMYQAMKQTYGFAKERKIPTYEEGIKMGLTPKYSSPAQMIAESVKRLEEVKAGLKVFNGLKDSGYIVPASVGINRKGFVEVKAPGFPQTTTMVNQGTKISGTWYAPKELADVINNVFSPKDYGVVGDILSRTRKLSGTLQDVGLSGGLPGTPLNAFTIGQATKESLALRPIEATKAFIRSFSDKSSMNYAEKNADQIIKMQERNIPVSSNFRIENLAGGSMLEDLKGAVSSAIGRDFGGVKDGIGSIWNRAVNTPTFQRFMPQLQIQYFNDIERAALGQGKTAGEAADIAAQAVKNFYGVTGTDVVAMGKGLQDPLMRDFLGTFTFAPKFRESMVNFWKNNLVAMKNPLALENRGNTSFVAGAIATYLGMDYLNYKFTGKHMSENPPGTEDKLLIPDGKGGSIAVPFLSSIATVPRALYREGKMLAQGDVEKASKDAVQSFASMLFKPLADVGANADYFGKPIYADDASPTEKYKSIGKYLATSYLTHPYLKELTDSRNAKDPAYERLSRLMEAPFKFYSEATLNSKWYYNAKDEATKGLNAQEQSAFQAIPKSDTNDPNTRILKYQIYLTYPSVFEAKQKIELQTAAQTGRAIDPLYLVNYDTAKKYMRYEALPEGSTDRKEMTKAYPELTALFSIRGKYFDQNPIVGGQVSQRPIASDAVQAAMNAKQWTAPGVREYLDANKAYNDAQREKLGLPPTASGFGGYSKKQKKVSLTPIKKGKTYKGKKISFKAPKLKMPKVSLKSTKKKTKSIAQLLKGI